MVLSFSNGARWRLSMSRSVASVLVLAAAEAGAAAYASTAATAATAASAATGASGATQSAGSADSARPTNAINATNPTDATNATKATKTTDSANPLDLAPATIESDVHLFTVARDGSVVETDETLLRANTIAGVDDIAQRYVWFNKDIERIDSLSAESIDPQGGVHAVGPDAIRDVQEPRAAGAPTFEDGVLRTVIFPGIEAGWREHLTFRKSREATEPGMFEYYAVPARVPVLEQRLIFDVPADMPLHADARGYVARASVTANGRTRYEFDYRHGPFARTEPGAVGEANDGDRLMVTSMPNYAAFAERYRTNALDPTANDPEVVALARALTRDAPDDWTKAARLYDWTRANIRYVALFLGETAAKPHRVIDVLRHRYGDCKDHVALYGALLAAVGVRNEPALIGAGSVYNLPSVPGYGAGAINHIIVWMPTLHRFADTTAGGGIAFGFLPPSVMDRPALLVDDGVLTRTPATQLRARDVRLDVAVDESGNARYGYRVEDDGVMAERERNVFRRATRVHAREIAYERLRQSGLHGTAAIGTDDVRATSGPFSVTMTGTLQHVLWTDGMTALPAWSSFAGGIASQIGDWLTDSVRTQSYVCMGGTFVERGSMTLPHDVRLVYVPSDVAIESGPIDYAAHYVFDPASRVVQISRRLRADFGKQVCTPKEFDEMRDALLRIERDTSAQIIVRENEGPQVR